MVRVEVLDNSNVVALLVRHALIVLLHHHAAVAVLLHVRWHLGSIESARASLLVPDTVYVLACSAALADGTDLVFVLAERLELVVLGVVNAVV